MIRFTRHDEGSATVALAALAGSALALWRTGDAKRPGAAELRDDVVRALERAGLRVMMRGCWDFEVRR